MRWTHAAGLAGLLMVVLLGAYTLQIVSFPSESTVGNKEQMIVELPFSQVTTDRASDGSIEVVIQFWGDDSTETANFEDLRILWDEDPKTRDATIVDAASDPRDPDSISGAEFAYEVVSDPNESAPVMDDSTDQFNVIIRPEAFTNLSAIPNGSVQLNTDPGPILLEWNVTTTPPDETPTPQPVGYDVTNSRAFDSPVVSASERPARVRDSIHNPALA